MHYTLMLCILLLGIGCTKEPITKETTSPICTTLGDITATTVQFEITLVPSAMSQYQEAGLILSKTNNLDISTEGATIFKINRENQHKVFTGLTPNTKYYYTTYLKNYDFYTYSETKEFSTDKVTLSFITLESISTTSANLICRAEGLSGVDMSSVAVGIAYDTSRSEVKMGSSTKVLTQSILQDGTFSIFINNLSKDTEYHFCTYMKQGNVIWFGDEIMNFKTKEPYSTQTELNVQSATDLSSNGSANSYIISNTGLYKFKTVKGNSTESVGSVASASILWETFGTSTSPDFLDLIKAFCYKDDYITFQTADTFKEGNAVIAAKDASGTILWSWHIWFTDPPVGQVYHNNAGTMMDRNIGATSATPGDVGALGLLYQWGRKDPFLGSASTSATYPTAASTISWPENGYLEEIHGNIIYATQNPNSFITNNSDWYYTGSEYTYNTRWTTSSSKKSIYDPCPLGWRVPDGDVWSKALGSSSKIEASGAYDWANKGMNFYGKLGGNYTIWYPDCGQRLNISGYLYDVGEGGYYWTASTPNSLANGLHFVKGTVYPKDSYTRATGASVRCIKE